jgi:hypothetical protein
MVSVQEHEVCNAAGEGEVAGAVALYVMLELHGVLMRGMARTCGGDPLKLPVCTRWDCSIERLWGGEAAGAAALHGILELHGVLRPGMAGT